MQIAKEYIRQNILNAALPLFYAKGYSKVTIREIADDSHVGLSNIYNYYNSKEDIFRELVQPVINDFEIMLDKHHGKSGSDIMEMYTEHYLRAVIAEYISLIKKYRNLLFLLLFRSQGTSLENYKRDFADRSTEVVKEYFRNMKIKHPELNIGEFYQFNLSSCIRQQNSLTAQFVSFSLANLANIFYPPRFLQ